MKQSSTHKKRQLLYYVLPVVMLFIAGLSKSVAQSACNNSTVLFSENFGSDAVPKINADVIGLIYQPVTPLQNEGIYVVTNNTHQKPDWQISGDHTTGTGNMMVINAGRPGDFYSHQINTTTAFTAGTYNASLYIMNVDTLGICGPDALLPNITFSLQYLAQDGVNWVAFSGSPMQAAPIPQTASASPVWVPIGFSFTLPAVNFPVKSIRIVLGSMAGGGCGDDFAIDDIKVSQCAQGGSLPVTVMSFEAHQKGSGVIVEWATSQEFNSSRFDIEKSADGSGSWNTIASVNAAGNSSVVKKYNAYDAKPFSGTNFYRIRQVDKDGVSVYSKTIRLSMSGAATSASVLANPFHSSITVDVLSNTSQSMSARIIDITGKQVASEKWTISNGSTRKEITSVSNLGAGMYILSISDANGQIIYNGKVVKQ